MNFQANGFKNNENEIEREFDLIEKNVPFRRNYFRLYSLKSLFNLLLKTIQWSMKHVNRPISRNKICVFVSQKAKINFYNDFDNDSSALIRWKMKKKKTKIKNNNLWLHRWSGAINRVKRKSFWIQDTKSTHANEIKKKLYSK